MTDPEPTEVTEKAQQADTSRPEHPRGLKRRPLAITVLTIGLAGIIWTALHYPRHVAAGGAAVLAVALIALTPWPKIGQARTLWRTVIAILGAGALIAAITVTIHDDPEFSVLGALMSSAAIAVSGAIAGLLALAGVLRSVDQQRASNNRRYILDETTATSTNSLVWIAQISATLEHLLTASTQEQIETRIVMLAALRGAAPSDDLITWAADSVPARIEAAFERLAEHGATTADRQWALTSLDRTPSDPAPGSTPGSPPRTPHAALHRALDRLCQHASGHRPLKGG